MPNEKEEPISRVDGIQKVTGKAKYFAEFKLPNMSYCVMATSTITRGRITAIDTKKAENAPGVIAVFTHLNMPEIPGNAAPPNPSNLPLGGQQYKIMGSDQILFNGQPIAMVIADTLERAQYAASLIKSTYQKEEFHTDLHTEKDKGKVPKRGGGDYTRGEDGAYKTAPVMVEENYSLPMETHSPMELHGILAMWEGDDKVTVYAKTQGVKSTQSAIMRAFKLTEKNVQVYSEFVGGGFGMALRTWPQEIAVVAAAKKVGRPVKFMMTRPQMFTMVGYRPATLQTVGLGATADGKLTGIYHEATGITSTYDDFTEGTVNMSKFMYACPNVTTKYRIVPLDIGVPVWMRGPGETTGAFALESAMDELSYKLKLDPIELRLRNYADTDPEKKLPFSSKYLKEAYAAGAEKIGWFQRNPVPRSMHSNGWLVGYGMSSGTFGAFRGTAQSKAILKEDGTLVLQSAASDIGPGTATAMTQIAHETLGLAVNKIKFELGDSSYPQGGTQGGSSMNSSLGSAVHQVCTAVKNALVKMTTARESSPLFGMKPEDLAFEDGTIIATADRSKKILFAEVLKQNNLPMLELTEISKPGDEQKQYSMYSFSVHFVEVHVHPTTGQVRVKRVVSVADAGKIVSPKTAASQMIGGATGGIGMALTEELIIDHRYGRMINNNFADYHVPVSADVPHIDTIFIDKPDPYINPMGAKGMGEIALIGFAAAVANAVYHATGKRIRELPITPDKLLIS
ncbi:MAG: xanthine dehydrogenase family protein molybdopterin-binding subunit [Chitinophagaceae bacterium]